MFKNKLLNTALLGATAAIALCTQQAFAFGGMGGGATGVHVGGMSSGRPGFTAMNTGASRTSGSVTMNGITVLPNGALIVQAVTPRVPGSLTNSSLTQLDQQQNTGAPCRTNADCAPY
jgi:hypothetical protein